MTDVVLAIAYRIAPIRRETDSLLGQIAVFQDITHERAAATARAKLATIVESTFEAIIAVDLDGCVQEWNQGAERTFGHPAAAMIGQPIAQLSPPEFQAETIDLLRRAARGEPTIAKNTRRLHRRGSLVDVSLTVSPLRDPDGRIAGAAFVAHDISELSAALRELRAAERSLLAAQAELERKVEERTRELSQALSRAQEVDRLKSEFLATMSHELRTPLNSIIGFTEIIAAGIPGPVNEEQSRQLRMALTSARHLLNLINDLLDLARIESGRFEPSLELIDPLPVLQEALDLLRPTAERKGLALATRFSLPAELCTDRKMYFQIVLNLLANAVKFTEHGRVQLTADVADGRLVTSVRDTGIGIKPEQMGLLFEAFRQVDGTSRRRYEGTGLGLYLCRRLLGLLGGEIHAESTPGRGSTFTFTLPLDSTRCHG